jgi:hypothetical protein
VHGTQAHAAPALLLAPPSEEHARLAAAFLGSLPGDERSRPAAVALASTAAALALAVDQVSRALAARGTVGPDGKPHPLTKTLASLAAAQISTLRAMRALPSLDKRVIASGAALERHFRGGRELQAPSNGEAEAVDWVARLHNEQGRPQ